MHPHTQPVLVPFELEKGYSAEILGGRGNVFFLQTLQPLPSRIWWREMQGQPWGRGSC